MGSILDAQRQGCAITIVIPNNDGGGIFSNLPIRDAIDEELFDELFHTPHGMDFAFLGEIDAISYQRFQTEAQLADLLEASTGGVTVLEGRVDTSTRLGLRDTINEAIRGK